MNRRGWESDRSRTEADNAALLDAISKYRTTRGEEYCQCSGRGTCRACALEKALSAIHPGAALLAEVEALREFHRAFVEVLMLPVLEQADRDGEAKYVKWNADAARMVLKANAAVDALKGTP